MIRPEDAQSGQQYVVDGSFFQRFLDLERRILNMRVSAAMTLQNAVSGIVLGLKGDGGFKDFTARIVSSTRDSTNWRWTYTVTQVVLAGTNAFTGTWSDVTGGWSGVTAYNINESNNISNPLGNGVNTNDFTSSSYTPQAIPTGTRVRLYRENQVWMIYNLPNGLAGGC